MAMSFDTFVAVLVFSIVMGFTPGPNNVMLASSGATYGVRRTWPHLMGVALGFPAMILVIGLGLASILLASASLQLGMKIVSSLYLLWLAFQIARSSSVSGAAAGAKPLTFLQAAAFQWINPKAWLIAVGAISAYTAGVGAHLYLQVAIIAAMSVAVSFSSSLTWAACGAAIGRWLRSPLALRLFNVLMAILLLASVIPILGEIWAQLRR
jgi:threonine/homoserine/homoserine lactone efflux protein